jgi:GT2 family glycosyltransferase/glycosyltransferase involved in cell wall biosynthesis
MKFPKLSKSNKKPRQFGHIDQYSAGQLHGWAVDAETPDTPLELTICANGSPIAEVIAQEFRQDLLEQKIGSGNHGFSVSLPFRLGANEAVEITLINTPDGRKIASNSFKLTRSNPLSIEVERVEGGRIHGFVHNADNVDVNGHLCLTVDGVLVSTGNAVAHDAGAISFAIPVPPEYFDGMPHVVAISMDDEPGSAGVWIDVLHTIQTPWTYLSTSAEENGYAGIPRTAGFRYESLRSNLAMAAAGGMSAPGLQNLMTAHGVVVQGYEGRKNFPKLTLPFFEKPLVSIVIPVHNKFSLTYHCIASLILAYNSASYEVVLVDDCSTDETVSAADYIENAVVVVNEVNKGFLLSCNEGARHTRGQYIVMLNNDTEVTSCWLDELIKVFARNKAAGMVGSKLLYPDAQLQEAGGIVWCTGEPWNIGNGKNARHPSYNYVRQADYLSGASLMISREVWEKVGGFSEEFVPAYYEDTDLAFKVRKAGYQTIYTPFSEVIHFEGMSNGRDLTQGIKKFQNINSPKFRAKWVDAYRHNGKVGENLAINMDRGVTHRVLMLDYAVPRPDQDAGSYAAVQEIRMLQANGFKVTFAAENMAHMGKYTDELQRMGVECLYAPFYTSIHQVLEQRGREFDLVFITRYDVADRHIENVRKYSGAKVLFNNADLHFLRELRAALGSKQKDLSGPLATRDRELALMRKVDAILTYNSVEHAVIASHNLRDDNLFICPWVVNYKGYKKTFQERTGIAFLGGYRHLPNVEAVEFFVKQIMPELRKKLPGVVFHVYGSSVPASIEALACDDVVIEGFVESLDQVFENCRVFVAPLLSGAGIKGKVLDAMSYSVPSVLSPVAAEGTGVTNGSTAFIASDPMEWADSIAQLYQDEETWTRFADGLEGLVRSNYSFEGGVERIRKPLAYLGIYPSYVSRTLLSA